MTAFEKINNIAFALLYGVTGISALIAAIFFGAVYQLFFTGICAIMVWALWGEIRRDKKNTKMPTPQS